MLAIYEAHCHHAVGLGLPSGAKGYAITIDTVEDEITSYDENWTVAWAAMESKRLLKKLSGRWRHIEGVVRQATRVARVVPEGERAWLVAAAYLHDIGWAAALDSTLLTARAGCDLKDVSDLPGLWLITRVRSMKPSCGVWALS